MKLEIIDENAFEIIMLPDNLILAYVLFTLYDFWNEFSAIIWFVKASTGIMKYKPGVVKLNPEFKAN